MAIFGFDVPYFGYVIGGIIIVVVGFLLWRWIRSSGGRLEENKQEERETQKLEYYERKAEQAQRDEKRQCTNMEIVIEEIIQILKREQMNEIVNEIMPRKNNIEKIIERLRKENMSEEEAISIFRELHLALGGLLEKLRNINNGGINNLLKKLEDYEKNYYRDLVAEISENRNKRAMLKRLWTQVLDEQRGKGQAQAT